ncbi:helix-turn-helix transcriptional regulator [Paenibacillus lactis]|uniref:Helix-turn-helix type 11 domain protein n=1 Tax=Paenibacillus lactis 154 TaxID=743719 RepID=G4HNN6_9BACL|nr:YafY family protein [Paenibacillus lactis]EHB50201.1 helix-turn-helix type 11 domain protein [Paenibacillus lactis 154]GIO94758.1 transcriptional regulator [Paenibacillus lactis]
MRADRLLSIMLMLQNGGKKNTRYLAEQLEVSERTIIRDMESLSAAGIPVYAERGQAGGWMLEESYRTNLTGMTREELISLLISSHSPLIGDLEIGKQFDAAYQKLLASSPRSIRQDAEMIREKIHIDGAGWHSFNQSHPYLTVIQEALWENRKLRIHYMKGDERVERIVHPLGLVAKRNTWYLAAETQEGLRTYRVSRIADALVLEDTFIRPEGFDLGRYWEESVASFKRNLPSYTARVEMTKSLIKRFERERYVKILHQEPLAQEGWIEADLELETLESASAFLLSCGAEIKVLAPQELRDHVSSAAKAICRLYE